VNLIRSRIFGITPFRTVPFFSKVKVSFGAKKIMALNGNFKIVILKFQFEPWLQMGKYEAPDGKKINFFL
jgi:hypothetical protein